MPLKKAVPFFLSTIVFIILTWFLGYQIQRTQFFYLMVHYTLFFLLYLTVFHYSTTPKAVFFFTFVGLFLRFLLIFAFPNLSDDVYRFIWDGRLLVQGVNPFDYPPSFYMEQNSAIPSITNDLYQQLNSPNYFTVYPPVNQAIFTIAAYLSPDSYWGSSVVMKSFLFLMEGGSLYLIVQLLSYFKRPVKNVLLYALNPLIIFEIMGNIHFEGAMVFFLLLGIWLIAVKKKLLWSAVSFAFSIASKLLPLIFLPFLLARLSKRTFSELSQPRLLSWLKALDWQRNILFFAILLGTLLALFLPLLSPVFITNFRNSLNLYFQKFEFNASIYYLLRWVGFQYKGYNIIQSLGPKLSLVVFLAIIWKTIMERNPAWQTLFEQLLFAISLYLFLATTIHPWYVTLPVLCCLFTSFRFPILWSGLVFLTYINYSYVFYYENLWIVALEYTLVGIFVVYEMRRLNEQ